MEREGDPVHDAPSRVERMRIYRTGRWRWPPYLWSSPSETPAKISAYLSKEARIEDRN